MLRNLFIGLLLVLFVWVCFPLITPVAMGGVFAILFYPWFERLEERKVPSGLAAAVITLSFTVLVLLPISILIATAMKAGVEEFKALQAQWQMVPGAGADSGEDGSWMSQMAHHPRMAAFVRQISRFFPVQAEELIATTADALKVIGLKLGQWLGQAASRVPGMALALVVAIVSLYFFLVDGKRLALFVRRNSFFTPTQTSELMGNISAMARSVVLASVASGIAQSFTMLIGMLIVGIANPGMIGFLIFLGSFLPLVGSAPVTLTVVLITLLEGKTQAALILGIFAALTSLIDNLVRPWVLKGGANMHPLMAFVSAFGGLQLFGLSGLFLGPIVAGLFMAVVRLNVK
jgi:predicted PurR-regulated permease PerM